MRAEFIILRLPEVIASRGRSKTSHYEDIAAGLFPKPIRLGGKAVGWPQNEVEVVNAARIAGKTDLEIRDLVLGLEATRKSQFLS